MSERARALAQQFAEVNGEAIAFVESCTEEQWRMTVPAEGWPVGVVAHHIAIAHPIVLEWILAAARGEDTGFSRERIDAMNAEHALEQARCTRAETLELLRNNGEEAARAVQGLDDTQLQRTAIVVSDVPPLRTEQVVRHILIGHIRDHLAHIRTAIDPS